jgi:surface-anchored protein
MPALPRRTALCVVGSMLFAPSASSADPVILRTQHVDLRIVDRPGEPNRLGLVIHNADSSSNLASTNAVLEVPTAARIELPDGFEVFGAAGSPLWILPQSQDPQLMYLGFSAEGIPAGTFDPRFTVSLVRVEGPGDFFVWQFDTLANLVMAMNSRDGVSIDDSFQQLTGGHQHFNWGFNAPGVHDVVLKVSNRLAGTTNVVESDEVTFRFGVEPYTLVTPAIAAVLSAPSWSAERFHCTLSGTPGRPYALETSSDLQNWSHAGEVRPAANGTTAVDLVAAAGHRFLRALTPR